MARLNRGDIHLCEFASPDKRRPVLILTNNERIPHLTYVTVAKITSTVRDSPAEVYLDLEDHMRNPCVINLDQLMTLPLERVGRHVARLSDERMKEVCKALTFAVGCD